MPRLKNILNPRAYLWALRKRLEDRRLRMDPNWRGAVTFPPGHFYSPLLDIQSLGPDDSALPFDGAEWWEHVELQPSEQRSYYECLLENFPPLPFPSQPVPHYRYYTKNRWFPISDAFTLSAIIQKEKPCRIVEVGSGFSSAVMLDTMDHAGMPTKLTLIEPHLERLDTLLQPEDKARVSILDREVQKVPFSVFDQLEAQDILFIDSSHVIKVGSDVSFLLLRILPRLRSGVIVHFHDVFYPYSYPAEWIREGRAWNESLVLRAFLAGNAKFQVMAFNSFVGYSFPEMFQERFPAFMEETGGSIWLRKIA
jgi:predicted O-methyltransferase YrrM